MKQKQTVVLGALLMLVLNNAGGLFAQDKKKVALVTTGKMCVTAISPERTVLFVAGDYQTAVNPHVENLIVNTLQDGKTVITGNFVHDAQGNAFSSESKGVFAFSDAFAGQAGRVDRYITSTAIEQAHFDRNLNYVAFPRLEIDLRSNLRVPGRMGIDASSVVRKGADAGKLWLLSEAGEQNLRAYDASLRVNSSDDKAIEAGSVVVERYIGCYRPDPNADVLTFPFSSPFEDLRSGYFAGQWIRSVRYDQANYGNVSYTYGNDPDPSNPSVIDKNRYVIDPTQELQVSHAHYVTLKPAGFAYDDLPLIVESTGDKDFSDNLYRFDGKVYNLEQKTDKKLFYREELFRASVPGNLNKTINWVIGNSYTSALDMRKLVAKMDASGLKFDPSIYVYLPGSNSWSLYPCDLYRDAAAGGGGIVQPAVPLSEIPAMSIFMVRVSRSNTQSGTLVIDKSCCVHSNHSHSGLRSNGYYPEIVLHLSGTGNPGVSDHLIAALRPDADATSDSRNLTKIQNPLPEAFHIYTLSAKNAPLSVRVLPKETKSIPLYIQPSKYIRDYTLTWSRQESLQEVWLEDLKTGQLYDLHQTEALRFEAGVQEDALRFTLHFTPKESSAIDTPALDAIGLHYASGALTISSLSEADAGSMLSVVDMQGRVVLKRSLRADDMRIDLTALSSGVYFARIDGSRTASLKFSK